MVDIGSSFFGSQTFLRSLTDVGKLVSILVSNAMVIAGVVFVFLIVFAGINMISASGDPQKAQQAANIITTAILGFILIVAAFFIVRIIEAVFGVNILG